MWLPMIPAMPIIPLCRGVQETHLQICPDLLVISDVDESGLSPLQVATY